MAGWRDAHVNIGEEEKVALAGLANHREGGRHLLSGRIAPNIVAVLPVG